MTATPQHIDAVADVDCMPLRNCVGTLAAQRILDSTEPAVHAAMLDALTRHGVLERVPVCHEPGFTHLVQVDWAEVAP